MKNKIILLAVLAMGTTASHAAITALVTSGTGTNNNHNGTLGGTFTANSSGTVVINRLGFYDHNGDGLAVAHTVGLYLWNGSSAYTLEVSASVPSGTTAPLEGGFRWVSIADYTLSNTGGQSYLVYATTTASDGDLWGTTTAFNTSIGTTVQGWYGSDGILGTADLDGTGSTPPSIFNIANVGYIPEPSAAALAGLAGLGLALRRRRA